MTQKETTNIILRLRKEGWSEKKILDFLGYVANHDPTAEETREFEDENE